MVRLLVVHHSPTRSLRTLLDAVVAGAADPEVVAETSVDVVVRPALEADADDVMAADAYVLLTPANFGYMSGALKHFFDRVFLEVGGDLDPSGAPGAAPGTGGRTAGRPYGLVLHGRYDLTGARRSVESIAGALGWKRSYDVLEALGPVADGDTATQEAYAVGATIAALLTA